MVALWSWCGVMAVAVVVAGMLAWKTGLKGLLWGVVTILGGLMTLGFVSAVIGLYEMPPYYLQPAFYVSLAIGAAGSWLFGVGSAASKTPEAGNQFNRKDQ